MLPYPNIDPVLIAFGPLQIRWYGVMYLLGFIFSYFFVRYQLTRQKALLLTKEQLLDLYFYLILGLVFGARLGYILFYNLKDYLQQPLGAGGGLARRHVLSRRNGGSPAGRLVVLSKKKDFFIILGRPGCGYGPHRFRVGSSG